MRAKLAIEGGTPVRSKMLPYARQTVDIDDRRVVDDILKGDWLTTGPAVSRFEGALCGTTGSRHAVAVSSGTAALHAAMFALGIGSGDEVIVPAISFVASANCILYQGSTPVFVDVCKDTLNLDPADVERKITPATKAIVAVDFAGHPCDYAALRQLAARHGLRIVADAAHSLGATDDGRNVGTLADLTALSFHPVKLVTTGEGGAILTDDAGLANKVRSFRHHGIDLDLHARNKSASWVYDVVSLGFNYRIPDINCALGVSQLAKLPAWLTRRQQLAAFYGEHLSANPMLDLPAVRPNYSSAWHLYVVRLNADVVDVSRTAIFEALRAENIGVNVHYIPIPWMSHYQTLGYRRGQWPVAECEYERVLSIPLYPGMSDFDAADVVTAFRKIYDRFHR
jgi:perosamine synthetase